MSTARCSRRATAAMWPPSESARSGPMPSRRARRGQPQAHSDRTARDAAPPRSREPHPEPHLDPFLRCDRDPPGLAERLDQAQAPPALRVRPGMPLSLRPRAVRSFVVDGDLRALAIQHAGEANVQAGAADDRVRQNRGQRLEGIADCRMPGAELPPESIPEPSRPTGTLSASVGSRMAPSAGRLAGRLPARFATRCPARSPPTAITWPLVLAMHVRSSPRRSEHTASRVVTLRA